MEEAVIRQLGSEETAGKILSGVTQWWCLEDGLHWNPVLGAGRSFAPRGLRGSEALKFPTSACLIPEADSLPWGTC